MSPEEGGRHGWGARGFSAGVGPDDIVPRGPEATSRDISGVPTGVEVGEGSYGHPVGGGRDAVRLPQMHRTAPTVLGRFFWCRMSWVLRQKSVSREGGSPRRERDRGGAACPAPGDGAE